ncbi:MAG: branched-chain amino acid transaminase [Calditrichaeota bacterium]|nr:branched-chain amino acid transaminase [Calditrichota bacterium]MCB9391523.1 branched-chain amino acid transaminase [Calditrichota bacterium]
METTLQQERKVAKSRFDETLKIWMSGKLIHWEEATVHIATHALHYGSAVFEGIRAYKTERGTTIWGLKAHIRRLLDSAKIYRMPMPFTQEQIELACAEVVLANNMDEAYLRPLIYRGYHSLGVHPRECPTECSIIPLRWGKYLGAEALEMGVDVMVSSWNRIAPNTMPALAKSAANYANSQLHVIDATNFGFVEGIALDTNGYISEGSGENVFVIRDGKIVTPPLGASVLPGITRGCVLQLAHELNIPITEGLVPREMLYIADEVFFSGTAAEITPVRSVDKVVVGEGKAGPITKKIQTAYFDLIQGRRDDALGLHYWL